MTLADFAHDRADFAIVGGCVVCGHPLNGGPCLRAGTIQLFCCAECESWSSHPRIDISQQAAIHNSAEYFEHAYFKGRRQITSRLQHRCRAVFGRLSLALDTRSLRSQRLLDIGCDTGAFLECAARQFGIQPVGLDVSQRSVSAVVSAGIEAYHATIETAPANLSGFSAITAIDVLEHVTDPASFLRAVSARLAPGGAVYLETPNIGSAVYRLGRALCTVMHGHPRSLFERLFPPQHIQYFTVQGVECLTRQSGLEIVRVGTRILPWADISTSFAVRAGLSLIQLADRLTGNEILIWAVLRKPLSPEQENPCD